MTAMMMREPVVIGCDVVVVGTGAAGMMAALTAAESGARVCCISKMPYRAPSCTTRAHGDVTWATRETKNEMLWQVIVTGGFLSNQHLAWCFVQRVPGAVRRLQVLGAQFDEPRPAGEGMPGTVRWSYRGGDAGQELLELIRAATLPRQVSYLYGHAATVVLLDDSSVCGLAAISLKSRQPVLFSAPYVVLATGGGAGIFARTDNPPGATGDGIALAYEAGAEIVDLELISFGYPQARVPDVLERGEELREELLGLGHAHYFLGGIRVNARAGSSVGGLLAAGEVTGGLFGAGRLGGSALADCLISGQEAGRVTASHRHDRLCPPELPDDTRDAACDRIETILRGTTHPAPLQERIRAICWRHLGPVKTEASITRALEELDEIAPRIAFCGGANREDIRMAVEVRHMHAVAQLVARASLQRRETRGCYWRADYPEPDNETQLRNIVLRKGKDGCEVTSQPPEMSHLKEPTLPRIGAGCFGYLPRDDRSSQGSGGPLMTPPA